MNNTTFFLVVGILALACFVGLSEYLPARLDTGGLVKMSDFPMKVGDWQGEDVPLAQQDYMILETTNLIMRRYQNHHGQEILLYIIYSDDNRKVTHPPEICYMGSGATITDKGFLDISSKNKANKMIAELKDGRQLVVYWYRAGEVNTNKYFEQQLRIMARRTWRQKTSAAMIRVSAVLKDGEESATSKLILDFVRQIEPLLPTYVP